VAFGDFLDAIGIARAAVVGHSLGALMAAAFARRHGDRVDRLILAAPASGYAHQTGAGRQRLVEARLAAFDGLDRGDDAQQWARRLLGPAPSAEHLALLAWNMRQVRRASYAQAARLLADGDIAAELAGWLRPLLVISGSADAITPEVKCRAVAASAKEGRYRSIAGAGHSLHVEAAGEFNAILVAELEGDG
jgi:pimeloyl-ACP methyl ester carboxylesterase